MNAVKRSAVEALLSSGAPVMLQVDGRACDVPEAFRGGPVAFRIGYGLTPPIMDLATEDAGVTGTLSFGGEPYRCTLPWVAIYAAKVDGDDGSLTVWPSSAPREDAPASPPPVRRGHLRSVS